MRKNPLKAGLVRNTKHNRRLHLPSLLKTAKLQAGLIYFCISTQLAAMSHNIITGARYLERQEASKGLRPLVGKGSKSAAVDADAIQIVVKLGVVIIKRQLCGTTPGEGNRICVPVCIITGAARISSIHNLSSNGSIEIASIVCTICKTPRPKMSSCT